MNRMTLIARLYVGVMFGVLVAIGTCALYAYERNPVVPVVEQLIVCLTFLGIVLVSALPVLLGIHRRTVARSAAENFALFERASLTDNLTRIGNRRAFDEDFAREVSRAKRNHYQLALALIDVDNFTLINHRRGQSAGDDVLMLLANRLGLLRQEDRAYRVGSDEFAVLLVDTEPQAARIALARFRKQAQKGLLGATISVGYVNLAADLLEVESYELAVMALCEAKRRGPSGVVCFQHITGEIIISAPRRRALTNRSAAPPDEQSTIRLRASYGSATPGAPTSVESRVARALRRRRCGPSTCTARGGRRRRGRGTCRAAPAARPRRAA